MRALLAGLMMSALAAVACSPAAEARRVALVIGNSDYLSADRLANPVHDAEAVAQALTRLKFDVALHLDLGASAMRRALQQFETRADGAEIALVYFAGHGIEVDGQNYLIPTDARLARAAAVEFEAISLSSVTNMIAGARKLRLVILDACRNNPFRRQMVAEASGRTRSIGRGLKAVEPGDNELIAFAAAGGTEAEDGSGRHSPFTTALLKHIERPGLEVNQLFRNVRDDVVVSTGRTQRPHVYGTLGREQIFLGAAAQAPTPVTAQSDIERLRRDVEELKASLLQRSREAADAAAAASPAPAAPSPSPSATRVAPAEASQPLPTAASRYQEAEAARILMETARRNSELALLDAGAPRPAATPANPASVPAAPGAEQPADDRVALVRDLQQELRRGGCYHGTVDGRWGEGTRKALRDFARVSRVSLADDEPTSEALQRVRLRPGRICPLVCDDDEVERNGRCVGAPRAKRQPPPSKRIATITPPKAQRSLQKVREARQRQRVPREAQRVERARPTSGRASGGGSERMCFSTSPRSGPAMVPCSDARAQ